MKAKIWFATATATSLVLASAGTAWAVADTTAPVVNSVDLPTGQVGHSSSPARTSPTTSPALEGLPLHRRLQRSPRVRNPSCGTTLRTQIPWPSTIRIRPPSPSDSTRGLIGSQSDPGFQVQRTEEAGCIGRRDRTVVHLEPRDCDASRRPRSDANADAHANAFPTIPRTRHHQRSPTYRCLSEYNCHVDGISSGSRSGLWGQQGVRVRRQGGRHECRRHPALGRRHQLRPGCRRQPLHGHVDSESADGAYNVSVPHV